MDIRFLETFLVMAECGSIAEASRRLGLTAGAVAQRVKALESDLGQDLIFRAGRNVRPTPAGIAVQRHAPELLRAARDLKAVAAVDLPAGQLRVGCTASALTGLVPGIIARSSDLYPQIEYFLKPGSSVELYHDVLADELDAALIVRPPFPIPKAVAWQTLRVEPLLLLAPEGSAVDDIRHTIQSNPFIRYDRNQWGGQIVERYLRQHELRVREWAELDALDAIATLVSFGLGVAIVPDWAPPWPEGLKVRKVPLSNAETREVGILWNVSSPRIAAIRAFVGSSG